MDSLLKKPHHKPAFVLGNGRSRLTIDARSLLDLGTIYGCNAQYREFAPHFLVAVDVKMVNEIISAGYHKNNQVWTNPNKGVTSKSNINFFSPHKGWSSGPTALWFAAQNNHRDIYILGFDYHGAGGKFNNVYADTFNYKKSTDSATFFGNWLNQTEKVIREYKNTKFYRVVTKSCQVPDKLGTNHGNISHITYDEFNQKFQGRVYSYENVQKTTI